MKILKNSLRILLVLVTVLVLAVFVVALLLRRAGIPDYDGTRDLAGLTEEVKVIRDERGVPHIYAANAHDLYFMTGYVTAQERLWQMYMIRHATQGRLSELFKRDMADTDHFLRALNMTEKSGEVLAKEDPVVLSYLQAYTDGVNTWVAGRGNKLPVEFRVLGYKPEPWTLIDIANIIGVIGWDLASSNLSDEIRNYRLVKQLGAEKASELIPDWTLVDEVAFPGFELSEEESGKVLSFAASMNKLEEMGIISLSGSNNCAVSSARSETGKPILSNDMHLGLNVPGYWMQVHQVIPGELNVTGVLIPGEPFIVAGHNEKIAWGMTNLMIDDIDLFVETVDSSGSNYLFNGEWLPLKIREEVIRINEDTSQTRIIKSSHRGPV